MSFGEAVGSAFSQYVGFSGRACRSEYWYFTLFNFIVSLILEILAAISDVFSALTVIYSLAVLLPTLAVSIRRLHDVGKSGAWLLIGLLPLVGEILLLVWYSRDSQPDNEYGPNPKNWT